jgi:hypothetical protein
LNIAIAFLDPDCSGVHVLSLSASFTTLLYQGKGFQLTAGYRSTVWYASTEPWDQTGIDHQIAKLSNYIGFFDLLMRIEKASVLLEPGNRRGYYRINIIKVCLKTSQL